MKAFRIKILLWTPKSQYTSLIHIIIFNEIFCLRILELTITIWLEYNIRMHMHYFIYCISECNNKCKL